MGDLEGGDMGGRCSVVCSRNYCCKLYDGRSRGCSVGNEGMGGQGGGSRRGDLMVLSFTFALSPKSNIQRQDIQGIQGLYECAT